MDIVSTQTAACDWTLGSCAPKTARIITLPTHCPRAHTASTGPKMELTPTPMAHITLPCPTPSPGHPQRNRNLVLLVRRVMHVCIYSDDAAATAALCVATIYSCCCCFCLLPLFVIVNLPPEVVLQQSTVLKHTVYFITDQNTLIHPLTVQSLLYGLGYDLFNTSRGC